MNRRQQKFRKAIKENRLMAQAARFLTEGEMENAQSALAAKDLVDRIQDMVTELGKMSNEDLPTVTDSIRASFGPDLASTYSSNVGEQLTTLLTTVKSGRDAVENATLQLTGEGQAPTQDLGLDDGDGYAASPAASGGTDPLGRGLRDEAVAESRLQKKFMEAKKKTGKKPEFLIKAEEKAEKKEGKKVTEGSKSSEQKKRDTYCDPCWNNFHDKCKGGKCKCINPKHGKKVQSERKKMSEAKTSAKKVAKCRYCGKKVEYFGDVCPGCEKSKDVKESQNKYVNSFSKQIAVGDIVRVVEGSGKRYKVAVITEGVAVLKDAKGKVAGKKKVTKLEKAKKKVTEGLLGGIYGGVIVNGREYQDDDIKKLIDKPINGWKYAGDQANDESCINVHRQVFGGRNGLPQALKYLKNILGENIAKKNTVKEFKETNPVKKAFNKVSNFGLNIDRHNITGRKDKCKNCGYDLRKDPKTGKVSHANFKDDNNCSKPMSESTIKEGVGRAPRTVDSEGNKYYTQKDGSTRKIRADVKPVKDPNADAVKKFAFNFFNGDPYSSARVGPNGEYRRYSFGLGNFAGVQYTGGEKGTSPHSSGFKHFSPKDQQNIKAKFAELKQKFLTAAEKAGLDTSLINLKLNHGTGFYASVIVKLNQGTVTEGAVKKAFNKVSNFGLNVDHHNVTGRADKCKNCGYDLRKGKDGKVTHANFKDDNDCGNPQVSESKKVTTKKRS